VSSAGAAFPVPEGQTPGIIPPGAQENGRPHGVRLYSVASPRDGERPGHSNVALTIKRVTEDRPGASIMMICTGTGSAPMRAMPERRRRMVMNEDGKLMLFFGARRPDELSCFGPLMKLPKDFIDIDLALARETGQPETCVPDLIRARGDDGAHVDPHRRR